MSRYLLDTNILYWLRLEIERIPEPILALLEDMEADVYYSVISPWELAVKQSKQKIAIPSEFYSTLSDTNFEYLPVETEHVLALRTLPLLHNDPFDRMLAAQAAHEHLTLVTSDKRLAAYPIKTLLVTP